MAFLTKSSDNKTQGNRTRPTGHSWQRLPLQAKLRLGQPGDAFEQEADKMADRVVNTPDNQTVQRQGKEEEETPVQTKPLASEISRYIQKQGMEEEEPVQTQAEEEESVQTQSEEEEPVQAQSEEEEPVQAQTEEEESVQTQSEEEEPVQTQTEAITNTDNVIDDPELEQLLASTKSGGEPLELEILQEMESQFNTSFAHVRIHRDSVAAELNQRFNSKAFTHGSHIYFNEGQYDPTSTEGKRLLAHELTHVLQQAGGLNFKLIQRVPNDSTTSNQTGRLTPEETSRAQENYIGDGQLNNEGDTITFQSLPIPPFKLTGHRNVYYRNRPLKRNKDYSRGRSTQRSQWRSNLRQGDLSNIRHYLEKILKPSSNDPPIESSRIYAVKTTSRKAYVESQPSYIIGTFDQITQQLVIPLWNRRGRPMNTQVDHIIELQLADWPSTRAQEDINPDQLANYELLAGNINMSSGSLIENQIKRKVRQFLNSVRQSSSSASQREANQFARNYHLIFQQAVPGRNPEGVSGEDYFWTAEQIENADHLNPSITQGNPVRAADLNLGNEQLFYVFPSSAGGVPSQYTWRGNEQLRSRENKNYLKPYRIISKRFFPNSTDLALGEFSFELPENRIWRDPTSGRTHPINRLEGAQYAGYLDKSHTRRALREASIKKASPFDIDNLELTPNGITANGNILPNIPLLPDLQIQYTMVGDDISVFREFRADDFNIPQPFSIDNLNLTVGASTQRGLFAEGRIDFGIEQVGSGYIEATTSTERAFDLEGEFNFDSQLFNPARVEITYHNNIFGVTGEIGIPEGKVKGIKNATINVSYSEETLNAEGAAELDIRGVEQGTLSINYSPEGWSIGGTFNLSNDIPGIQSGFISATVSKVAGEEGYQLTASGTAIPAIPGISSELNVEYDNGAITIQGRAAYNRGLLSGEINLGATNRTLDDTGQPTGDPTDTFIVYGGGSLTIQITPWLQGTVGIQFQPDGQMIVSGRISLPSSIDVFDRIGIPERELFGIGFDIPIFAIPVGPKSIGLVASISGGLKFYAGIGPGRLEGLELGVTYNPDHPEQTHVSGSGRFVIPAEAGLKLFVRATIGLSAVIGGVEGGLELSGGLGLEAEAAVGIDVDWTPETGLELRADLGAYVQPKFVFTIDGVIRAWITFYDKEWRWRLADYEYGPDMSFGINLPIVYREGEPFNVSFDDLQVQRSNLNTRSFLGGLIRDIRSRRS